MTRRTIDRVMYSLLCVRLGQELGTDSRLARAIIDVIELMVALVR